MAWIRVLTDEEMQKCGGRAARVWESCRSRGQGTVDNVLAVHSLRPETLDGHLQLYRAVMFHPGGVSRREREAIAVAVSACNACHY